MCARKTTFLAIQFSFLWATVAWASTPRVPDAIGQLMQDRKYAEAVAAIDAVADDAKVELDYLAYLKARALHFAGDYDAALKAFDAVEQKYPDSPWTRRARFAKGLTYARQGDFRSAELAYRTEAEYLFSPDRKQEIAGIYLEYADEFFKPCKEDVKPDYAKALDFFQRALKVGPKAETRVRVELAVARCQQELGNLDEAAAAYRQFLEINASDPLAIEARFRLGETLLANGQMAEARQAWRDLLDLHATSESDLLPQAAFRVSETYSLPEPDDDDSLLLGVASLKSFLEKYPQHELAPKAILRVGQSHIHRGRYEDAAAALQELLADPRYAQLEEAADARNLLGLAFKRQGKFDEALAAWQQFLVDYPTHQAWSSVQQEIINTHYAKAASRFQQEDYAGAKELWSEFLISYPLDDRSRDILFLLGEMEFRQEHWNAAIDAWRRLVSKYPDSDQASRAQFRIALTTEEKLGKLDLALEEYKKVKSGSSSQQAQVRIARLTAKALRIATERTYRSDETPELKLWTRNIEKVTVRIYTVDLETYYRKMHQALGVESLDIALIDPDASFDFEIPDYVEYKQHESQVSVPLPGIKPDQQPAGVMAITVSSDTLEATTMMLQSDLEILVKSSRDEVFVFAQNLRTGEPWPQARLLLSNGEQVFAETTTGDDGVFQQTYEELETTGNLRVFAVDGGHTASNIIGLDGLGVAQGLTDRGYIYTDRSTYRPGQMVHLRGVLRKEAGDAYQVAEGKSYQVDVYDSRNRLIADAEVTLNGFGSFHTNLLLPAAAVQGRYRIVIHDRDQENYQGQFQVQDFRLEPIQLEVDTPRTVYYRGEEIEGVIRARFYYGAPLAGREIRYQLTDDRAYTAVTDEAGEVHFRLPTRGFRETQNVVLSVDLTERNLSLGRVFHIATQGFSLATKTARNVYLAGETFELQVTAADADGKPVEQALKLSVLRRTEVAGESGETLVEEHELQTDAAGAARQTLQLKDGGSYWLRVSGVDRFENTVEATHYVDVSGDDDQVRLRILADRHSFQAGETAQVRLHWREQPALALVTLQGAKILEYRLVPLQKGENKLPIAMTANLAPNFDLAVAVMVDADRGPAAKPNEKPRLRFHQASSPFDVERQLNVSLEVRRQGDAKPAASLQPGEEVEVIVTATDPQGKPVAAELSLAMVEQALMERFPDSITAIQSFFQGTRRQSAVRTDSSITFAYRPLTRPINQRLLAESERLELAAEERSRLEGMISALGSVDESSVPYGGGMPYDPFADDYAAPGYGEMDGDGLDRLSQMAEGGEVRMRSIQMNGIANQQELQLQLGQSWGNLPMQRGTQVTGGALLGGVTLDEDFDAADQQVDFADFGRSNFAAGDFVQLQLADSNLDFAKQITGNGDMQVMAGNGVWFTIPGRQRDAGSIEATLTGLLDENAALLPNLPPHETGYWNPLIVTDTDGKATVTFALPDRSTAWSLLAKGVTVDTLAGEGDTKFTAKKDFFGQLKVASAFTDGDTAQIVASVHNAAIETGEIEVVLTTTIGDKSTTERQMLKVDRTGINELIFKQPLQLPVDDARQGSPDVTAEFQLTVSAGDRRDVTRQTAVIRPDGMTVFAIDGGSAAGDAAAVVEPPAGMTFASPRLQIVIGPSVEQSLLDTVLAPPMWCQMVYDQISPGAESAASDLLAALALQRLVVATRDAGGPQAASLEAKVRSAISVLISMQADNGGWGWTEAGDPYMSARVLWALSQARQAGYRVEDALYQQAAAYVKDRLGASRVTDYETKAVLLHALTVAGESDFPLANQLYRNRPSLSSAALAYLALTFAQMDRDATAEELLTLLDTHAVMSDQPQPNPATKSGAIAWNDAAVETRALYALTVAEMNPADPRLRMQVDWLMAKRAGFRWAPDKATGPAMQAVCRWFARDQFDADRYELTVWVNDLLAGKLQIDSNAPTQTVEVPADLLAAGQGKHRIRFELNGRGRYTYQCVLGGFVPSAELKSTTKDWTVARYYEPATRELDGREIPRGFDVLTGSYKTFRNNLTELPVGQRGRIELRVQRENVQPNTPTEELPYLVVTEPLPGGVAVVDNSVQGDFERFEWQPGSITFYLNRQFYSASLRYEFHGYLAGEFHASPTVVRNTYAPDQIAVAPGKSLTVLTAGAESADEYRWTPRELYELGKRHFDKGDLAKAAGYLNELFNDWNLQPEIYRDTVRMLLDIHLEQGPASQVVKVFEIIIEKFPEVEIAFDKLLRVGDAYHAIGEYERSYLVFRATVEASFLRESRLAGFLESQSEFLRSVEVMTGLMREYPPEPYLATAEYALAQRVYAKAPEAAADEKLREKKVNRVDLIREAWSRLDVFLTANPEDPAADQGAFSLANALLDLELYESAITHCERFAGRYPDSDFLDSYWYIVGFCHFARSEHQRALDMCQKVAEAQRKDKQTGRMVESPNKWQAIYILGQIHHSLGQAEAAIREYERVEERFADARQAIDYFAHRRIALPEVVTVRPGEPASMELTFRNVSECNATVYRIDLMKYSLLRRDLSDITSINLAGIRPYHQATIKLGDGKDYRDRTRELELPLQEEGAYLVVCRGENLYASGMVLVSPLALEMQEEADSGRVRATVRNTQTDAYVSDVHVKVIGTYNDDFVSGETDLRGVFIADGINGRSMVIAEGDGGRYAFYRGEKELGSPPIPNEPAAQAGAPAPAAEPSGKAQLLENLKGSNLDIQMEQQEQLQEVYDNSVDEGIGGGFGGGFF